MKRVFRIISFVLIWITAVGFLTVHALAADGQPENPYVVEVLDGEMAAAALYEALVAADSSFIPQKNTTNPLKAQTGGIDVTSCFSYSGFPGGGIKYKDGTTEFIVGSDSKGNAVLVHDTLYSVQNFVFSGSKVSDMKLEYLDTGKYFKALFYYEPVIGSVTAQNAAGSSMELPSGAAAELRDHDNGRFYKDEKATISVQAVEGYDVYVADNKLELNEATGKHELAVTVTDSTAYHIIYKKQAVNAAEVTYTEIRTDAAGNVTSDGTSGMVTGATASAVYEIGEVLTYRAEPVGNWYVKSIQINGIEQLDAASFGQNRSCTISYMVSSTDAVNVAVELAEKFLQVKEGVQSLPFNPAKTVAEQMHANGTVNGSDALEKLLFETVIASGSQGKLPDALAWDSRGVTYAFKSAEDWHPLDFAGDDENPAFPAVEDSAVEVKITWTGDAQYPEVSVIGSVVLADCRAAAPTYDITLDSKTGIDSIRTAAAVAAGELELPAEVFQITGMMKQEIGSMAAGETKIFELTAQFAGNTVYKPGSVTVRVEISKAPLLPATVTLSADETKGVVTITDSSGSEINLENPVTDGNELTVCVEPNSGTGFAYAVQSMIVTENDVEILRTGAGTKTASFCVKNSETVNNYTINVTYAERSMMVKDSILRYNRFYDGKVTQCAGKVKAELLENVLAFTGNPQTEDLKVYVWNSDAGEYHLIDGSCEESQTENKADAAFTGDRLRLQILWSGDDLFPELMLTGLEVTLQEIRQILDVTAGTYPDEEPVPYNVDHDAENREKINGKALRLITTDGDSTVPQPSSYLYAVDEETSFSEDFTVADDGRIHMLAVKMIWDSTAEYLGTSAVVSIPVKHQAVEDPHEGMCKLAMDSAACDVIVPGTQIYIGGDPYTLDETCTAWLDADAVKNTVFVTAHRYHTSDTAYGTYPVNMYVWCAVPVDEDSDGKPDSFRTERVAELDDFFCYEGTSICVKTTINSIRFFTSVPVQKRERLMQGELLTGSLKDFHVTRIGTVFAKVEAENKDVTLKNGICSDVFGGKAGSTFRTFSKENGKERFTGVLTGLDAAVSNGDILARPYAVLEYNGQTLTLYGGQVCRSIYYVATQNRDYFPAGSVHDKTVEDIIAGA